MIFTGVRFVAVFSCRGLDRLTQQKRFGKLFKYIPMWVALPVTYGGSGGVGTTSNTCAVGYVTIALNRSIIPFHSQYSACAGQS